MYISDLVSNIDFNLNDSGSDESMLKISLA